MPSARLNPWSRGLLEFTGERVVPGLVDPNLLNEHVARYRFAACFAAGADVLDAGCGAGYGSAELGEAASVVGIDLSADAVMHAKGIFGGPRVRFLRAACETLPFADGSFDLVLAFEVIEHLVGWREMIEEARRVLRPKGLLLVSTPNKAYYAETRAADGPNPVHVHECESGEFRAALAAVFRHVRLWSQNHSEAIAFVPETPSRGALDAPGDSSPGNAHFFLAACSQSPIAETRAFAWLPKAGNLLREREHHVALLDWEVKQKTQWLKEAEESHAVLHHAHEELLAELHRQNEWAERLGAELKQAGERIGALQEELITTHAGYQAQQAGYEAQHAGSQAQIAALKQEAVTQLEWIRDLESQIASGRQEIGSLKAERHQIARSKWLRLGRAFGLGPIVKSD
jgi:SAM-dependent methyltransferase